MLDRIVYIFLGATIIWISGAYLLDRFEVAVPVRWKFIDALAFMLFWQTFKALGIIYSTHERNRSE